MCGTIGVGKRITMHKVSIPRNTCIFLYEEHSEMETHTLICNVYQFESAITFLCFRISNSPLSEIEQLQAQLATEQKRVSELNREISSRENRLTNTEEEKNVLQRELDRLRQSNEELQAELSEAQQQLAEMEKSMKKATNTVTSLKKVFCIVMMENSLWALGYTIKCYVCLHYVVCYYVVKPLECVHVWDKFPAVCDTFISPKSVCGLQCCTIAEQHWLCSYYL